MYDNNNKNKYINPNNRNSAGTGFAMLAHVVKSMYA